MIQHDKPFYQIENDEEPLYNLEEEDQKLNDNEPPTDDNPVKRLSPIGMLFRIMFTPVEGWKSLKRARFRSEEVASRCFYPLIALAAVCDVAKMFYESDFTFSDWAIQGLTIFIAFFFGYFTVLLLGSMILPKKSRALLKTDIGKQFVMVCLSTLAIFYSLICLFPMVEPVLVFLPIWTIYLIYKGVRILRVDKDVENSTTGYLCLLIIGVPIFWNWLFSEYILPLTS